MTFRRDIEGFIVKAFLALMMVVSFAAVDVHSQSQTVIMPLIGSEAVHISPSDTLTICESVGSSTSYDGDGAVYIESDSGTAIHITGHVSMAYQCLASFFDGIDDFQHRIQYVVDTTDIDLIFYSGVAIIKMKGTGMRNTSQLMLTVCAYPTSRSTIGNVNAVVEDGNAHITWTDNSNASSWTIKYGTSHYGLTSSRMVNSPEVTIEGLPTQTTVFYKIFNNYTIGNASTDTIESMRLLVDDGGGNPQCIDYANLYGPNTTCYYGNTTYVYTSTGVVNLGPGSINSRHTIHTNANETDPRTNNHLHTVPSGFSSSVRLGNWDVEREAEAIVYKYFVDTNYKSLMILNYAVVMENPGHTRTSQPRFTFEILDAYGVPIDPQCYSAFFVSSDNSSGWSSGWKDWTAVGYDLSGLHYQNIYVRLITYDCGVGAHYGYAYFTLECIDRCLLAAMCGDAEVNTYTAPEGFSYAWYEVSEPDSILSEERILNVTQNGDYRCILTFKNTDNNDACSFELSANDAKRYPYAQYSYSYEAIPSCALNVHFTNNSIVTRDSAHTIPTGMECDGVEWIFDGQYSDDENPTFVCIPGSHTVSVIARLDDGGCTDTLTETIFLRDLCYDTVYATICYGEVFQLYDTVVNTSGVYERDSLYFHRTLYLTVLPQNASYVTIYITENELPYTFNGRVFNDTVSGFVFTLTDNNGCDSSIYFNLQLWRNQVVQFDTTVCDNVFPFYWSGATFNGPGTTELHYTGSHNTDSTVVLTVKTKPTYHTVWEAEICPDKTYVWIDGVEYYEATTLPEVRLTAANGCDSTIRLKLTVANVNARMRIIPEIADFDHNVVTVTDVTPGSVSRTWNYLDALDTSREISFVFPYDVDSVPILLSVFSMSGCSDSVSGVARADHARIWSPNAFTPDEAQNNLFFIKTNDITEGEVWIYTRQGQLVTHFDLLTGYWDGTYRGNPCPIGAYTWTIRYTTPTKPRIQQSATGTVLLLR